MLLLTAGAGLILYPYAADWFVTRAQAGEVARHTQAVNSLSDEAAEAMLEAAHDYNRRVFKGMAGRTDEMNEEYQGLLRPDPSEIMGQVTMPTIGQSVPIWHGTSDWVLYRGAGHQYGTSLPVGGPDTHSVITAHSGLVTARLFTELERLTYGDLFMVSAGGQTLFYEVDHIVIVLPGEYQEYLEIIEGRDLVTLFTCTPTGVNTHRLLVRGTRVSAPEELDLDTYEVTLEAGFPYWAGIIIAVLIGGNSSGRLMFRPTAPPSQTPTSRTPAAQALSYTTITKKERPQGRLP